MKIIIAGCGKVGTTIISSLASEGHDVVAIDSDPSVIDSITNVYDVMGVSGNCADRATLNEAGVDKTELFIAVTGSDELNMLSCFIAGKMGSPHTIARIRNPEYNDRSLVFLRQQLGLSMAINPEMLAAQELFNILKFPSAVKLETFSRRNFAMIELRLREDTPFDGVKLSELRARFGAKFLICTVQRGDDVYIPDGHFELKAGDKIGLTATLLEIQKLLKNMGIAQKKAKDVMILGGSRTAYYLARMLINTGSNVKIIEQDAAVCEELCETLPKSAVIIQGDGTHQELLLEEGITSMDAFVSLTGMDEENILLAFFASSQNVHKVIAKISRDELATMAERLGLETKVSPKNIVSDVIVQYARALENSLGSPVETLYKLNDGAAEALEFIVNSESKITGIPLKDLATKSGILIAGIFRDRKPIVPAGDDMILPGDRVIVVAAGQKLRDLSDIV